MKSDRVNEQAVWAETTEFRLNKLLFGINYLGFLIIFGAVGRQSANNHLAVVAVNEKLGESGS